MPNDSLIHADIFFFISTIALILISAAVVITAGYVIRTLSDIREIVSRWKEENENIIRDTRDFRTAMRSEGVKWKFIADKIASFFEHILSIQHKSVKKVSKKK
ncbi:MAG: hypothetical protein COV01_01780 [Candidatus Taylorbacteria bacterium CG10_big_fil_rev_8_21_14_0_10_41_48]|uniref:Uncharacterized protein n=1 Tax=Candidatus Taylorbacteria bacterium CG10_big_fil_rev_8_21_14_0_10_41_48 TaxID=1975024 RepID=A0A2M8LC74_9BACT|nr:MAG: hypothetical protein COV01_01780 [Candidatus Taylorbacteria bacterium CG10_big_fil_rev_8_21_14_0_10_41_48]